MGARKPPLITRLPIGLREQPAWVFIGILIAFSGLSFVAGIAESAVAQAIGELGLKLWGSVLSISGTLLVVATIRAKAALEKLALRIMSFSLLAYAGYVLVVAPLPRAVMSLTLTLILCGLAEFRVMHLKALMQRAASLAEGLGVPTDE